MDPSLNQDCDTDLSHLLMFTTAETGLPLQRMRPVKKTEVKKREIVLLVNSVENEEKSLETLLSKLTWSELIHLRMVDKRWHSVIHSMGEEKKLLIFSDFWYEQTNKLKRSFFGTLDFDNCAHVNLKKLQVSPTSSFGTFIVGLFPSVDQLVFVCNKRYPIDNILKLDLDLLSTSITSLSLTLDQNYFCDLSKVSHRIASRINLFTSLKQLGLDGQFGTLLPLILPTIRRVDHFSYRNPSKENNQLNRLVSQFGPNCTRFALYASDLPFSYISQWRNLNPQWLARLTHLQLYVHISKFNDLAQFLSENAPFLQVLRVEANRTSKGSLMALPSKAMNFLSQLGNLAELDLEDFFFKESSIDIRPLVNVCTCTLRIDIDYRHRSNAFSWLLSRIFPKVQHLNISVMHRRKYYHHFPDFDKYLYRFPALLTHKLVVEERHYD